MATLLRATAASETLPAQDPDEPNPTMFPIDGSVDPAEIDAGMGRGDESRTVVTHAWTAKSEGQFIMAPWVTVPKRIPVSYGRQIAIAAVMNTPRVLP